MVSTFYGILIHFNFSFAYFIKITLNENIALYFGLIKTRARFPVSFNYVKVSSSHVKKWNEVSRDEYKIDFNLKEKAFAFQVPT